MSYADREAFNKNKKRLIKWLKRKKKTWGQEARILRHIIYTYYI